MRIGFYGIGVALASIAGCAALISSSGHVAANVAAAILAGVVLAEGALLAANWRGSARIAAERFRAVFPASPLGSISRWELRMVGGFLALIGLILLVASIGRV